MSTHREAPTAPRCSTCGTCRASRSRRAGASRTRGRPGSSRRRNTRAGRGRGPQPPDPTDTTQGPMSAQPATDRAAPRHPRAMEWLCAIGLCAAVVAAYAPVRGAGFIWDDDMHITQNPCIVGPLGLADIWTSRAARYFPLVLTTFWAEHAAWGLNPLAYHAVNVFMHGAC